MSDFCVWEYRYQGKASTIGFPKGKEANVGSEMGDGGILMILGIRRNNNEVRKDRRAVSSLLGIL